MKTLYKIKYFFNRLQIKRKIAKLGQNAYIKRRYTIYGGKYVTVGENTSIREGAFIQCFDRYCGIVLKPNLLIGKDVFINRYVTIFCADSISIGNNSFLGSFVTICDENHGTNLDTDEAYGRQPLSTKPTTIGSNCWIGDHCVILPGVSIGDNSIIGAGSVVTKSVPPNCLYAGNPAKPIKRWDSREKKWKKV